MKLNLDSMRSEIQEHLESHGMVVFHGQSNAGEHTPAVYWDTEEHPDYRAFLASAEAAGVKLVALYAHEFTDDVIEEALERLETSGLPRDERRTIEQRLREMRGYAGFTCQIELSFDLAPRVYIFDVHTDWYDELNDMLDSIEEAYDADDEEDGSLGGGYFSKN